ERASTRDPLRGRPPPRPCRRHAPPRSAPLPEPRRRVEL
ncbi:MAG: hypothetical protein AVDCRST_MAG08-497, partial [uncultured Acetobacteraceae bacterium]